MAFHHLRHLPNFAEFSLFALCSFGTASKIGHISKTFPRVNLLKKYSIFVTRSINLSTRVEKSLGKCATGDTKCNTGVTKFSTA